MTAITTVVFDLGNVLVGWDPRRVWSTSLDEASIQRFLDESDFGNLNRSLDAGRPYVEARRDLEARHPQHVATLDAYWHDFGTALTGPIPGSAELVGDLAQAGVRLLGLTNWSAETFHHAPVAAPAIGLLEAVLVSGEVGLAKPDPAIFALLIERFGLTPGETLFADDSLPNVVAARSSGLHGHHFATTAELRADLRAHGVSLPAGS